MKKKLLVLGAGNAQIDLIKYCKEIGLEVYGCSYSNTDKGIKYLDNFQQINIIDVEGVENYVRENNIDYIYSVGSDIAVPTICRVAENTEKFHFVSSKTAQICCNKHLMREALGAESPFNIPYMFCNSIEEAKKANFYPLIMKPVDSQGQRGVYCVNNFGELAEHFSESMSFSKSGLIILERYISGQEVSVNAYVKDKKVIFSILSDREAFADLPGGIIKAHHLPSVFEGTETHKKVNELVTEVVDKLEINNGPVYFQIKVQQGQPYLIEVTPRLDGCHMWHLIKEYCGVNLLEITMSHFLGNDVNIDQLEKSEVPLHTEFFCEPPATIFNKDKFENQNGIFKTFYYENGDVVKKMNGYMEKCGYRIFKEPYKIGLVGGSGFVGRNFIKMYANRFDIKDISRSSGAIAEYSSNELEKAMKDCDSIVIMAAKKVNQNENQSLALYFDNVEIIENTLIACNKLGIKNIVYLSSRCVYSNSQKVPIAENGIIAPINYYGISKYTGELLCEYYNRVHKTNIKILRLSQIIGENQSGYMVDSFINKAINNVPLTVYGKSLGKRDYIYIKDACKAIWMALLKFNFSGVYNIGSGIGTSNLELAQAIINGFNSMSHIESVEDKPEDENVSFLDTNKAKKELGFSCDYSLKAAFYDLKQEN